MAIKICYLVIYMLEAGILWQYCRTLFLSKYSRSQEALALLVCYSLLYVGSFQESFWVNFFMFLFINPLYLFFMYNLRLLTALFHAFLITIIMVLSELGILSIISYFAPNFYDTKTYFRNLVILSVTSKILYFLVLQCTSFYIRKVRTRELSSDKSTLFLNVIPFTSGFIALVLAAI